MTSLAPVNTGLDCAALSNSTMVSTDIIVAPEPSSHILRYIDIVSLCFDESVEYYVAVTYSPDPTGVQWMIDSVSKLFFKYFS